MNENNLAYLKKTLDRMDFPAEVGDKLAKEIEKQEPEIKLNHEVNRGNETVNYDLNFRKSETTDMYFFNSYNATLKTGNEAHDKTQEFRIRNGNNIGADEAFNLIAGRAVQKSMVNGDGDTYQAWLKVDFSQKDNYGNHNVDQFHDRYGYDLEKAVNKFPIAELAKPEGKAELLASLKAGNSTAVTMTKDSQEAILFIEANPRLRTINIKDEKGVSVKRDQVEIKDKSQSQKIDENQGQQNNQSGRKKQGLSV
ncbi:hypothetical protein [Pedobacter frigoris]|uniref:Uncharacterized protein n=1 Tax=Pedobacter frigoris TaxID=2571272 RepID=A0A4U1CF67_9SPHI|nr:hypothetical protein [Pedobacter frigoris]TKC04233.1 hypothetical protein FA047_16690 [Pedobacter frigoris]